MTLVENRPFGAAVVILRRLTGVAPNIIVMDKSMATPELLASAAVTLNLVLDNEGDTPIRDETIVVNPVANLPAQERLVAERVLARAGLTPPRVVPQVGRATIGLLLVPNQALRDQQRRAGKFRHVRHG